MQIPELILTGPHSITASVPFIIGFTPHDSLIVLWLRNGCVRLTMRLDLPPEHEVPREWVDAVMRHRASSDEVIICVMPGRGESARDLSGDLRARDLVASLLERLSATDCHVRDAVLTTDDRWWSYLCQEPECCSPAGTPIDPEIAADVASRFAFVGVAPLPDRQSVIAACAADASRQVAIHVRLSEVRRQRQERLSQANSPEWEIEAWRDDAIALVRECLITSREIRDDQEAEIVNALRDVRVRDTVLWEIAQDDKHDAHRAFDRAAAILRAAPPGYVAPIGAVTALLAWLIGDGVRATSALDRVRAEDPDYMLAELLSCSISAGLPPSGWLDMMRGLSRDSCRRLRHGSAPAA